LEESSEYQAYVNSWLQNPDETQNESVDKDVLNIKDKEDWAFGQVRNYQENWEIQFGVKLVQPMMFRSDQNLQQQQANTSQSEQELIEANNSLQQLEQQLTEANNSLQQQ